MRGGWVGSDVWDKVPKKTVFVDTFPNCYDTHATLVGDNIASCSEVSLHKATKGPQALSKNLTSSQQV